jgi:TRAP-type C4-dicarboxylate transport system permease large subunit
MAFGDIPLTISSFMIGISDNPIIILLCITAVLLVIGTFMDMTPALLIFTPILMPVMQDIGIDPVHFGIIMTINLCVGICTPPVGSALFVGCSISGVSIGQVMKPILPFYLVLIAIVLLVTFVPQISLFLPQLILGY